MCQSFPVKKIRGENEKTAVNRGKPHTTQVAAFSLLLFITSISSASAAFAQSTFVGNRAQTASGATRVISILEGRDKASIELTTDKSAVVPRPIIKFLPQDNGDTVMVADFVGLSWQHPTRVFSTGTGFGAREKGIKVVRAGSFQERPAICRISITSNDKNLLSRVSFGAGPGKLTVTWPKGGGGSAGSATNTVPRVALPTFAPPQRSEQQAAQSGESIRRVDFDGSHTARPREYSQPAVHETAPRRSDAELATRAAALAARRDLELAAPRNAAPLAINTAQDVEPPVAPSHGLSLRPEIGSDFYGVGSREPVGANFAETPLKAVAQSLEPLTRAANQTKPANTVAKPAESYAKPAGKSANPVSTATKPVEIPAKPASTATKSLEISKLNKQPPKQPIKLASNNVPPPVAPKRAVSKDLSSKKSESENITDTTNGASTSNDIAAGNDAKGPKRKGLLSSLFKKVKETLTSTESDDVEGQDSEQGTANSQLDEPQPDKAVPSVAASAIPAAPPRSSLPQPDKPVSTNASNDAQREQPPLVEVVQSREGTTVRVTAAGTSDLNFHTFKLQDPPRFVVDFDNLHSISAASIKQPDKTNKLLSIRVGAPDGATSTGRLVLDLASPDVTVIPSDSGKPNVAAFTIGTSQDSLAGLVPRSGSTIVLDAGHGGSDAGAQRGSVQEKELTLSIAKATQKVLESRGIKVIMTRDSDTFVSLQDRVNITNSVNPDLFLSVHINAMESTNTIYGIETYYQNAVSQALASAIHESLTSDLEAPDRRIRKARFVVINRTEVPAVLAEVGFISNKAERDKLVSADYQEKIANALAKGAILFLNQQSGATKHLADRSHPGADAPSKQSAKEWTAEAGSDSSSNKPAKEKRVDSGVPSVSRLAQKGLNIHQK